ncbi:MAG: PAS domain-containing protein, partial [Hansschlegelia sp.]
MPGLGWASDHTGRLVYVNKSVFDYLGIQPSDLSAGYDWRPVIHPDERDAVVARWLQSLDTGEPYEIEHRVRRFDGVYRWFRAVGHPSYDASGRVCAWHGTTIDIDDRKQAELALRANERRLQDMLDALPAMVWSVDEKGLPLFTSKALIQYSGLGAEESSDPAPKAPSLVFDRVVHPDDRPAF